VHSTLQLNYFENKSKSSALEMREKKQDTNEDELKDAMKTSIVFESIRSSVLVSNTSQCYL
jgi:hypothetical protein